MVYSTLETRKYTRTHIAIVTAHVIDCACTVRNTITHANYAFALYPVLTTGVIRVLSMRTIHQHLALTN